MKVVQRAFLKFASKIRSEKGILGSMRRIEGRAGRDETEAKKKRAEYAAAIKQLRHEDAEKAVMLKKGLVVLIRTEMERQFQILDDLLKEDEKFLKDLEEFKTDALNTITRSKAALRKELTTSTKKDIKSQGFKTMSDAEFNDFMEGLKALVELQYKELLHTFTKHLEQRIATVAGSKSFSFNQIQRLGVASQFQTIQGDIVKARSDINAWTKAKKSSRYLFSQFVLGLRTNPAQVQMLLNRKTIPKELQDQLGKNIGPILTNTLEEMHKIEADVVQTLGTLYGEITTLQTGSPKMTISSVDAARLPSLETFNTAVKDGGLGMPQTSTDKLREPIGKTVMYYDDELKRIYGITALQLSAAQHVAP